MHNINVKDLEARKQLFNVAVPTGEAYTYHFENAGIYDVSCDIHPGMSAQIVATTTPYVTLAEEGRFEFPDVVTGPYTLIVYAGAPPVERQIDVTGPRTEISF